MRLALVIIAVAVVSVLNVITVRPRRGDAASGPRERSRRLDRSAAPDELDLDAEAANCARFAARGTGKRLALGRTTRRRVFWGGLIADDAWTTIEIHAAEAYGLYDVLAFVESDATQTGHPRKVRFGPGSDARKRLEGLWGPRARVVVDLYAGPGSGSREALVRESLQRARIAALWAAAGMRPDDVAVVGDVDEMFSRDFLRAASICGFPEYEDLTCRKPKVLAAGIIFEGSPRCIPNGRWPGAVQEWHHPDLMLGACVEGVGDATGRPVAERVPHHWGERAALSGGGGPKDYPPHWTTFPLWDPTDFRQNAGGGQYVVADAAGPAWRRDGGDVSIAGHTGFHFHNFFETNEAIRFKYLTYGHPMRNAGQGLFDEIGPDLALLARCARDQPDDGHQKGRVPGVPAGGAVLRPPPVFFEARPTYVVDRHARLVAIVNATPRGAAT